MSLEAHSANVLPAASAHWLQLSDWQAGGYPTVRHDVQTIAALEIAEIGTDPEVEPAGGAGSRMHEVAHRLVAAAAATVNLAAFELRYRVMPRAGGQADVRLYLLAKAVGSDPGAITAVESALVAAATCLPPHFVVRPVSAVEELLDVPADYQVVELQRNEQVTFPQWSFIPSQYYYHLDRVAGDGSGWLSFVQTLARSPVPLIVSILFKPTDLDVIERDTLGGMLSELGIYADDHTDYNLLGMQEFYPGDANARVALEAWQDRLGQIGGRPLLCRIAVAGADDIAYAYGAHLVAALHGGGQQAGNPLSVIGRDELDPPAVEAIRGSMRCMEIWPSDVIGMWDHQGAPLALRRFQYLYGLDEAASVAILPVPDEQGVPGFVRARSQRQRRVVRYDQEATGDAVRLGRFVHYGESADAAELPLSALNRHSLVVGLPGSGKTTTVMTILAQLWTDHQVPWAVIEPTRPEYRLLSELPGLEALRVITPGRDDLAPLRINPLAPPPGIRCATHMSSLVGLFRLAMPLVPPLPELLSTALQRAYLLSGWDLDTRPEEGLAAPTMRDLLSAFGEEFEEAGYNGEARNVASAFRVRLRGLLSGAVGHIVDTAESMDLGALLSQPVIVELHDIENDEDKALLGALILQHIRAQATGRGSGGGRLRHVTVLEEAHRLLPAAAGGSAETGEQTRARAAEDFVNAIAELRSSGEGFIICSQLPTRLAPAAIGNTSTRVVHHLTAEADRSMMLADIAASEADRQDAARLRPGEAIARWSPREHAEVVRIEPPNGISTERIPPDASVAERMRSLREATQGLLPYSLCTRAVCPTGCTAEVRRAGRALELRTRPSVRAAHAEDRLGATFEQYVASLAGAYAAKHDGGPRLTYCALVHALVERGGEGASLGLSESELARRRAVLQRHVEAAHGDA